MALPRRRSGICSFVGAPAWLLACSALALGCEGPPPDDDQEPTTIPLVTAEAWQAAPPEADPVDTNPGPDAIMCLELDWQVELGGLEIETTRCNYAVLQQPLLADIDVGARLRVLVWWHSLISVEPTEGHLAVAVGDQVIWEERIDIPGPADVRQLELSSPIAATAGTIVTLHLHNHGANTWNVNELALRVPSGFGSNAPIAD